LKAFQQASKELFVYIIYNLIVIIKNYKIIIFIYMKFFFFTIIIKIFKENIQKEKEEYNINLIFSKNNNKSKYIISFIINKNL